MNQDERWIEEALTLAREAAEAGEIPVGAVVIFEGKVVGRGRNRVEGLADPTAHAELLALRQASMNLGRWRLSGCTLYVTLEPCAMCLGACFAARLDRLVYGALSKKFGALGSAVELVGVEKLNHQLEVTGGVRSAEAAALLEEFFTRLRGGNRN
ncbi:tRNA adenosine(34) deaminase TadA [bacterium]|nr:tRNA adenosine(34) deaminase TadA [bacterium]